MEDILASIRRILSEDEAQPAAAAAPAPEEDVLVLDASMLRPDPAPPAEVALPVAALPEPAAEVPAIIPTVAAAAPPPDSEPTAAMDEAAPEAVEEALLAPETAATAAASIGSLLRAMSSNRALQVRTDGPTIEDMVRQMLRPLVKEWLDTNLPGLVERLVHAEIERVVNRELR